MQHAHLFAVEERAHLAGHPGEAEKIVGFHLRRQMNECGGSRGNPYPDKAVRVEAVTASAHRLTDLAGQKGLPVGVLTRGRSRWRWSPEADGQHDLQW